MKYELDIYNNNVVVTGASSGIGKEICKLLAVKYNCKVLGVARTESKLNTKRQEPKLALMQKVLILWKKSQCKPVESLLILLLKSQSWNFLKKYF